MQKWRFLPASIVIQYEVFSLLYNIIIIIIRQYKYNFPINFLGFFLNGSYTQLESAVSFQGGFAKCYELTDMETKEIYAGKIVSKLLLVKPHQREKVPVTSLASEQSSIMIND